MSQFTVSKSNSSRIQEGHGIDHIFILEKYDDWVSDSRELRRLYKAYGGKNSFDILYITSDFFFNKTYKHLKQNSRSLSCNYDDIKVTAQKLCQELERSLKDQLDYDYPQESKGLLQEITYRATCLIFYSLLIEPRGIWIFPQCNTEYDPDSMSNIKSGDDEGNYGMKTRVVDCVLFPGYAAEDAPKSLFAKPKVALREKQLTEEKVPNVPTPSIRDDLQRTQSSGWFSWLFSCISWFRIE